MNASHDDAQRELEQRALRNVHALARRLGRRDAMDRYTDRFVLISIGVVVFFVVTGAAVAIYLAPDNKAAIEAHRCELDAAVQIVAEMRADLKARQPTLTKNQLEMRVVVTNTDVKQEAKRRCPAGAR